jgi:large subunit ribosomal protein L6
MVQRNFAYPSDVAISFQEDGMNRILHLEGLLGSLSLSLSKLDDKGVCFFRTTQTHLSIHAISPKGPKHALQVVHSILAAIKQAVQGVSSGFLISLEIVGVGYRVQEDTTKSPQDSNAGQRLIVRLGQSHDIIFSVPKDVRVFCPKPTLISFYGIDKNQVMQTVASFQHMKMPEPYKGKGIRKLHQTVTLKQGKKK